MKTWQLDATHGDLPTVAKAFPAYLELLVGGDTTQLDSFDPASAPALASGAKDLVTSRGGDPSAPLRITATSRPSRGVQPSMPPSTPADVLGVVRRTATDRGRGVGSARALHVSVMNGDLKFVHQPLVVGHYRSLALTGTEAVVDRLVNKAMSRSLAAGLYPDGVGMHQIFGNIRKDPDNVLAMARPLAVIVAGLGEEGKLHASDLVYTVRQAVIAYAQRLAENENGAPAEFELAATLLGSGGTGVSAGAAAQLVAQGASEANQKLHDGGWPQVGRLILVEFYLDRASDAWRALQVQATAAPNQYKVVGYVESGAGALRRSLDSSYRGASYDFISAVTSGTASGEPSITYTLDTKRARTEVRAQRAQGSLVRELVAKASNDANRDPQIGRTLFDLLVPVEMEPFLGGTSDMVIELDSGTAALPWETLDTASSELTGGDPRPWAIRSKLLRKLRTSEFRAQISDADADGSILVIGEPMVDETMYPALPGARAEGVAVAARLSGGPSGVGATRVRALVSGNDDARDIINALFERPYRVVHVAGHGAPGDKGGVVLSGGTFLGPAEVEAMRTVPELVFLNCCHLAARDPKTALTVYDRTGFAANIAESLIRIGVRCVIAAGWAVEDTPAEVFATTFYDTLLGGGRFIDAVAAARTAAWRSGDGGNTWSAYQCYGDPGWTWHRDVGDGQRAAVVPADEFAGVSSPPALTLALETISIRLRFGGDAAAQRGNVEQTQRDKIRFLEERFAPLWGQMGAVAEAFGLAFADARDPDKAIDWYPHRRRCQRRQRVVPRRRGTLEPARTSRRIVQRSGAGAARHRRGDRAPQAARGHPPDGRARSLAGLGVQAARDGRERRGRGVGEEAQAWRLDGNGRVVEQPRPIDGAARDGAALRQRRADGARRERREPLLSGQERHERRASPRVPRTSARGVRGRADERGARLAREGGAGTSRLLVGRRSDRIARARGRRVEVARGAGRCAGRRLPRPEGARAGARDVGFGEQRGALHARALRRLRDSQRAGRGQDLARRVGCARGRVNLGERSPRDLSARP